MTKRPRLSSNMRLPAHPPLETMAPSVAATGTPTQPDPVPTAPTPHQAVPTQDKQIASIRGEHEADSLIEIFGESFSAMSLACHRNWHQTLSLQLRLSIHMLEVGRRLREGRPLSL